MADMLFLAHRIPYPPNKGDKIRSWHILRHLAERHAVHLGCFIDDPADHQHIPRLEALCRSTCFVPLRPRQARLASLRGVLTGKPLTFGYFNSRRLASWVETTHRAHAIDAQFVFTAAMAPYAERAVGFRGRRVIDFVDLDSVKWTQYAGTAVPPLNWIYGREGRLLGAAERAMVARADAALFVSPEEAALLRRQPGVPADRIHALGNGVDGEFFSPDRPWPDPYPPGSPVAVFTGMMDYRANIDAVIWFVETILPLALARRPDLRFWIVGARPSAAVRQLARHGAVTVTGAVADTRPYLAHAVVAVAPLRIARGIQNKVLEAMAMARPVVATTAAFEGIEAVPGRDLLVADSPEDFAMALAGVVASAELGSRIGAAARRLTGQAYGWPVRLAPLDALLSAPDPLDRRGAA
jgi:sugar transferase (PEP-CTERM/EpsH1 system associated)